MKKVFVFLDVANIWSTQKSMRKFINYRKIEKIIQKTLAEKLNETVEIPRIFYYEAFPKDGTRDYNIDRKHKFMTFLKKQLGFTVRKKPIKRILTKENMWIEKGNMDVELCIDAIHHKQEYDIAVFFTGDADFFSLVKYLKKERKKSYVFSSKNHISYELKTGTDGYFDISKMNNLWGTPLKYRKQKK